MLLDCSLQAIKQHLRMIRAQSLVSTARPQGQVSRGHFYLFCHLHQNTWHKCPPCALPPLGENPQPTSHHLSGCSFQNAHCLTQLCSGPEHTPPPRGTDSFPQCPHCRLRSMKATKPSSSLRQISKSFKKEAINPRC